MIRNQYVEDQTVCWKDGRETWRCGEVVSVDGDTVRAEDEATGRVHEFDRRDDHIEIAPESELKTTAAPRTAGSRVLLNAMSEIVEDLDVAWDDVGILWVDDDPVLVFSPVVEDAVVDRIRDRATDLTPGDVSPRVSTCRAIAL